MWVLKIESLDIHTVNQQRKKIQGKREKLNPRRHNHPQPEEAASVIGEVSAAVGGTATPRVIAPRTTAQQPFIPIVIQPSTTISWRTHIIIMPTISTPLQNIPMHTVESKTIHHMKSSYWCRLLTSFLYIIRQSWGNFLPKVIGRFHSSTASIFPLSFTGQPILFSSG
jgi:hypothetical protein